MKRSHALAPLSRDHHVGLVVAQKLGRATTETSASARQDFLAFWRSDGQRHFRVEEEVLLPRFARHGEAGHEAVVRVFSSTSRYARPPSASRKTTLLQSRRCAP